MSNRIRILKMSQRAMLVVALVAVTVGCDGNYRDVVIEGQVIDATTGQPVMGSEVNVICWVYDTKLWASKKVLRDTITDSKGRFSMSFERGEAIEVEVQQTNYHKLKYSKTLDRSIDELRLKLKKVD